MTAKTISINAAMSIAEDIAAGKLDPNELERQAIEELTSLMAIEPKPGSALWELQTDVCRRTLARGALSVSEIREFAAVVAARESPASGGTDIPADPSSSASVAHNAEDDHAEVEADVEADVEPDTHPRS